MVLNPLRWASLAIYAASAVLLALLWPRIPEVWVSHWGPSGQPDGWTHKSPLGLALPLLLGLGVWGLFEGLAAGIRRASNPVMQDIATDFIRVLSTGVAVILGVLALALPLTHFDRPWPVVTFALAVVAVSILYAVRRSQQQTQQLVARGVELPKGWIGLVYKNPEDPRLWVPKLYGLGLTLNFGHRRAWWMLGLLLLPLFVADLALLLVFLLK